MKFLVVGAGAVGGYFGARLAEKGEDVTFLVREKRKEQLQARGLRVKSIHGDTIIQPKLIVAGEPGSFDVVLIGIKAYHLEQTIQDIKPYVHKETVIIPMLNGMGHIDMLTSAFSKESVIGGLCFIESTLSNEGDVMQTSPIHQFVFGEWNGERTERIHNIEKAFQDTRAMIKVSNNIIRDMWHKYLFITTFSGVTTLFQKSIGPIRDVNRGIQLIESLLKETAQIMRTIQAPIIDNIEEKQMQTMGEMDYDMKSSMLRDMEKGLSVEVEALQGYLLTLAEEHGLSAPTLQSVYVNLKLYEKDME
ncbi:ketopantoate reductase family protein [Ectobacillus polymachus]|uniref:ketopantoate reductase family protein n=1 Tax=Ectobacillus polymachus TaxID=1508806 RepID=UPI003A86DC59